MPITTITGKNSYAAQQRLNELRGEFVQEHGVNVVQDVDGGEVTAAQLQQVTMSQGLFATASMVILRDIANNKPLQEDMLTMLTSVPSETHLIIYDPELDGRTSFFKALQKQTEFENHKPLDERELVQWARSEFDRMGAELGFGEAQFLVNRVNNDQWLLANELQKLALVEEKLTKDVIENMVDESFTETVFNLLDAAFGKQFDKALALYREMIRNRIEPHYIFSMIVWQLYILLVVAYADGRSPDEIAKDNKLSPFVVKKSMGVFHKTSRKELKEIVSRAAQIDADGKSKAGYNMEAAVDALIARIAS